MKKKISPKKSCLIFLVLFLPVSFSAVFAEEEEQLNDLNDFSLNETSNETSEIQTVPETQMNTLSEPDKSQKTTDGSPLIFDDKTLLAAYAQKYAEEPKEFLLAMIKDDALTPYMSAAALHIFRERFSEEIVGSEKKATEKLLLRRLNRANSNFVEIEVMHTLCVLDRYKYFGSFVPLLIEFIDHQNPTVGELSFEAVNNILLDGPKRSREARIVFNVLRRNLFLSRRKLQDMDEPGPKLKQKLELLRWAIKILGTQELGRLPPEVIDFL